MPRGFRGFRAHCWASDGLGFGLAPDAGYTVTITIGPDGVPHIAGLSTSYPSLEVWEYGGSESPTLVYQYDANKAGTGPSNLFGLLIPVGPK